MHPPLLRALATAARPRLFAALSLVLLAAPLGAADKTIIVGFDGLDHGLVTRFMEAGDLPNFQRLAEQGTFAPLDTTNPAQSAVSWAVVNTGANPGKTGVGGFVSRTFSSQGQPFPQPMLSFPTQIPAAEVVDHPMAVESPAGFVAALGAGAFVVAFLLLKLLRLGSGIALVLSAVAGGVVGWQAHEYAGGLPTGDVPYHINPVQGTSFWRHLDGQGVRMMGIQVASTFPPDDEPDSVKLLSGLGVPDIGGSPGTWFVYTDDPWTISDKSTGTGGKIIKVFEEGAEPGTIRAQLVGPRNYVVLERFEQRREAIEEQRDAPGLSDAERAALEQRASELEAELADWRRANKGGKVHVPFVMEVDRADGAVAFSLEGDDETWRVPVGGWSPLIRVEFRMAASWSEVGLVRFHVLRCDDEEVRVFVPPISIHPDHGSPVPISAPTGFAAELAEAIGPYETVGFGCLFNPLKDHEDSGFEPQSFLEDIEATMAARERMLAAAIDRADEWDVYFQIFYTTDRVEHMLFREADPGHPDHDAEYAARAMDVWGREFPMSDSIRQVYMQADRITGELLDRMEAGELGEDPMLLIVSDHGFTSFRRQVNLNNLLYDLGYLKTLDDRTPAQIVADRGSREFLAFVDWERTRAYSYGLGKVFVNVQGREPKGIVAPSEYDEVVEAIRRDLLAAKDPQTGETFVTSAERRDELFSGPWWKEGPAEYRSRGEVVEGEDGEYTTHHGFADIFLGYEPTYRVAWNNTMGGLDPTAFTPNRNHWSGGHVSVDPRHVPGILFSNRALPAEADADLIDLAPTLLARYGLDPATTEMDGEVLPFADLTR